MCEMRGCLGEMGRWGERGVIKVELKCYKALILSKIYIISRINVSHILS